jgi:hypothetical protein
MPIISRTRREKIVIRVVLGLRYETTPAQFRAVLGRQRPDEGVTRIAPVGRVA